MEGGMSYVGTMVCRHDEKGRICLLLSRGLFYHRKVFRQIFLDCQNCNCLFHVQTVL